MLPTGAGKTVVFSDVAEIVGSAGWRVTIFTHRVELLNQASRTLMRLGLEHGLVVPGRPLCGDRIHVASIDTINARCEHYAPYLESIRLAIVDEAHHAVCRKYMRVFDAMSRALRLGVTATPFRSDGTGLGLVFDAAVRGPTVPWLVERGYLAPVDIYAPPLHLNLRDVKVSAGDYVAAELERVLDIPDVTEPAVQNYARLAGGRPAIVFCATVVHARHVAEQFAAAGYAAAPVDGEMPNEVRAARFRGLADGSLNVLTSCELVSEGTDVPNVECGIMLRPTKSTGLFLQQGGRLTRPAEGKRRGVLIDMVGNCFVHGMLDEVREWSLDGGMGHQDVTPVQRCPACHRVSRICADYSQCPECGSELPLRREALPSLDDGTINRRHVLASMSDDQLKTGRYGTLLKMVTSVEDLERIARAKKYSLGWVRHQAREKGIAA